MDVISIDFEKGLLTCLFGNQVWISLIEQGDLLQYTGLKDKNGKEIYAGDILKYQSNGRLSDPIAFPEDYTWVKAHTQDTRWQSAVEVIGNRYENPELLQSK